MARALIGWGVIVAVMSAVVVVPLPGSWQLSSWNSEQALADPQNDPQAESMAERLLRGKKEFRELEYERAMRTLGSLHRDPRVTRSQRLSALEIIAISALILGDKPRAREAFQDLLAIDPGYQLRHDDGSPKIRDFYNRVKRSYVPGFDPEARVQLEFAAPTGASAGRKLEIEARILGGANQVGELFLLWRRRGELGYGEVAMIRGNNERWRGTFVLPISANAYVIDYYLEARGPAGGGSLGRVGGPENPLGLRVAAGQPLPSRAWYRRWYVIAGGAALLGMGTAALVLAGQGESAPSGTLEPGRISL